MKTTLSAISGISILAFATSFAAEITYKNFIRQVNFPEDLGGVGVEYNPIESANSGEMLSPLPINTGYARFDLNTISSMGQDWLLNSAYVGTYQIPKPIVTIISLDTSSEVPRTRVDFPFTVRIQVENIDSSPGMPEISKSVDLHHLVQSYGAGGDGLAIDREQAQEVSIWGTPRSLTSNGTIELRSLFNSIRTIDPSFSETKVRGEERFRVLSVDSKELASATIQVWPVATGKIEGIKEGDNIKFRMPQLTLTLTDLYPKSTTYLQAYPGPWVEGKAGLVVPFPPLTLTESIPQNRTLLVQDYDNVLDRDGEWTFELLHSTPFDKVEGGGVLSLDHVTVNINRTLDVNAAITTSE